MAMEDFFNLTELPETSVLKTNADVVSFIAEAIAGSKDLELSKEMFELLIKHSEVVLESSQRIICKSKMHLRSVK